MQEKNTNKVNQKQEYFCDSCAHSLGKGTRQKPSTWCNVWGWVHFKCSGLSSAADYPKSSGKSMSPKCSKTRPLVPVNANSIGYSKLHTLYTSCQSPASFGSRESLKKYSNCSYEQEDNYLHKNETYS